MIYDIANAIFLTLPMMFFLVDGTHGAFAPLMQDNVQILDELPGRSDVNAIFWSDSYSSNGNCYCDGVTSYDHDIGAVLVDTPLGILSVKEVCELLGKGPGSEGRPLYNDVQCGNGPPNNAGDEDDCPGRTEYGKEGCKYIGPKWNFSPFLNNTAATKAPTARITTTTPTKSPVAVVTTKKPTSVPLTISNAPLKPPTKAPVRAVTKAPTAVSPPTKAPVNVASSCGIVQLDLWNGATDKLVSSKMVDGMRICNSLEMAIDAITDKCVANVRFVLTGPNQYAHTRNEYNAPYFLYGNSGTAVTGQKLSSIGVYTVSAIPNGRTELTKTIMFNVTIC
jgi:hypothetical protein